MSSSDNIMDVDATEVAVYPKCDYHKVALEQIGGWGGLYKDVDEDNWWLDFSEFDCPGLPPYDGDQAKYDREIEKCQNSWYTTLEILVRE